MPKNKLNQLEDLGGYVFSTNADFEYESNDDPIETLLPQDQYLEAYFTSKGRKGKTVTIIKGFQGTPEALAAFSKMLKTKCGVGGSVKENEVIIQGNHVKKVMEILTNSNYNVKRIGG